MISYDIISYNVLPYHIMSYHIIRSPPPLTPAPFDHNQAPTSFKPPPSPHQLFDLQGALDKRMHFLQQLSEFVPIRDGFYSFRAQTD